MPLPPLETEQVASGRWLVRDQHGVRLGEVFGGNGRFQAQTMRGDFIGNQSTLPAASELLRKGHPAKR